MKPFLIFMLIAFNVRAALAASSAFDRFIASAWNDPKVTLQTKNLETFGHGSGFKPIQGMQLIVSQNEVIEDRKIALRVLPRGIKQDQLMSSLTSGQHRIESLSASRAVTDALKERYAAAAAYITALESDRLWSLISKVTSKRLSMLQVAARSSQPRAVDLIKERGANEESSVKAAAAHAELKSAAAKMKALDPSFVEGSLSSADLMTPSEMFKVVSGIRATDSALTAQLARENAARAHEALAYETAKDERLLDYVEVSYSEAKVNQEKEFGVKVALNIPGFSSTELSRSEKARELVKYEVEAKESERKESLFQLEAKESLKASADLYSSLSAASDRPADIKNRKSIASHDPLLATTLEEASLHHQIRQQHVASQAATSYIGYLAATGTLANRAHTNFLAPGLKEIRE